MHDSPTKPHLQPYADSIQGLQRAGRIFWERGWSRGTSSNYSVVVEQNPTQLLVTASGMDKGNLGPNDFVLVDANGKPTIEDQPKSSAETLLHCVAAELPNVGAVLHTHSVWSTVLSDRFAPQGGIRIEGYEMLKGLAGVKTHEHSEWLPIYDNTQDIPSLAETVKQDMQTEEGKKRHGYVIRRHGIYTWGKDLDEAFRQVEIIEFLLESLWRSAAIS